MKETKFHFAPIGTLRSVFREKFGVPRQSLMMSEAKGVLKLNPDPDYRAAVNHLADFSHVWVLFVFDQNGGKWHPVIDTPRIGEVENCGVFASRSPHRPNPIGMSVVRLDRIDLDAAGGIELHLTGVDILDGTPVLDIKPYVPYVDSVKGANSGWLKEEIERYVVTFSEEAARALDDGSRRLIEEMLSLDPRPTSQKRAFPMKSVEAQGKRFAFRVLDYDIHWEARDSAPYVIEVRRL